MCEWLELARASTREGDELRLRRREAEFEIRFNGWELVSTRSSRSEEMLATLVCRSLTRARSRMLIGGLGMGFTVRAALDALGPEASITVCELIPAIIDWNRTLIADLARRPLDDGRVTVVNCDVVEILASRQRVFDAVLLDVDNGPEAVLYQSNQRLYSVSGLELIKRSLGSHGTVGIWSADVSSKFEKAMDAAEMTWKRTPVDARGGTTGPDHTIYIAQAAANGDQTSD
ncbi:MAG: hypothetical protein ABR878_07035 [Roseiarcus sp.]|jgi:spermidine synthase